MAAIYKQNKYQPGGTGLDWFAYAWYLTRLMQQAGWRHMASSDGAAKSVANEPDPGASKWGGLAVVQAGAAGASIGAAFGADFLFTGLSGLVASTKLNQGGSEGNYLVITGAASAGNNTTWQITNVVSATSCYARVVTSKTGVASDVNNGFISWVEKDAKTLTYITPANSMWIVLRGPSTMKIPFVAAPVGTFLRGENIIQSTTGAEAEVLGVTYEPSTGAGFIVVHPRHKGTGAGRQGWGQDGSATYQIGGTKSGATVNPSGTAVEFGREIMYQRGTTAFEGTIYYQCCDLAGESTSLFSYLAWNSAGCTATIAPGAGGVANGFPTAGTYVPVGTGGSVGHCAAVWTRTAGSTATNRLSNGQYFVSNCIARQNVSEDGSYLVALGQPTVGVTSMGCIPYLMHCDNQEEGDLEPYYFWGCAGGGGPAVSVRTRTPGPVGQALFADGFSFVQQFGGGGAGVNISAACSWRRRGYATGDAFAEVNGWTLVMLITNVANYFDIQNNTIDPENVAHSVQNSPPRIIDFPLMANPFTLGTKVRKGVPRWIGFGHGNVPYDTFGGKTWMQVAPFVVNDHTQLAVFIPWDGSTVPVQ